MYNVQAQIKARKEEIMEEQQEYFKYLSTLSNNKEAVEAIDVIWNGLLPKEYNFDFFVRCCTEVMGMLLVEDNFQNIKRICALADYTFRECMTREQANETLLVIEEGLDKVPQQWQLLSEWVSMLIESQSIHFSKHPTREDFEERKKKEEERIIDLQQQGLYLSVNNDFSGFRSKLSFLLKNKLNPEEPSPYQVKTRRDSSSDFFSNSEIAREDVSGQRTAIEVTTTTQSGEGEAPSDQRLLTNVPF